MYEDEDFGGQRDYKAERDTLIDDITVLRANNKRLERENEKLNKTVDTCCEEYNRLGERSKSLEKELKTRREETDNLEAKLSAQLSMKRDLEKENQKIKEDAQHWYDEASQNQDLIIYYQEENKNLKQENEKLKQQNEEIKEHYNNMKTFIECIEGNWIGKFPDLT